MADIKTLITDKIHEQGVLQEVLCELVGSIPDPAPVEIKALKFTSVGLQKLGMEPAFDMVDIISLEYSYNGEDWETWDFSNDVLEFGDDDALYIRGNNPNGLGYFENEYIKAKSNFIFDTDAPVTVEGRLMYLIDSSQDLDTMDFSSSEQKGEGFYGLFDSCEALVDISGLILPNNAQYSCYYKMFQYCTNIIKTPELPALILEDWCYRDMFAECSRLSEAIIKATDISAEGCILNWVSSGTGTGVIKCDPSMVSTFEADSNTPAGWTVEAIS